MDGTDTNLHKYPMVFVKGHVANSIMYGVDVQKVYVMQSGQYHVMEATTRGI